MREWWDSTGVEEWKAMGSGECDPDRCDEHVVEVDSWISSRMRTVASAVVGVGDANLKSRKRNKLCGLPHCVLRSHMQRLITRAHNGDTPPKGN